MQLQIFTAPDTTILLMAIVMAGLFSWYTIRRGSLTTDGALAASLVGLWVLFFAGPLWLLPLFFFFISSTLLGRLSKRRHSSADAKHGKARDWRQVLCNGGIYAFAATFIPFTQAGEPFFAMAASISVSTADTWSSEIGIYYRGRTFDILRGRPVPVGLSGGVSGPGTLSGLAGAISIAFLVSQLQYGYFEQWFFLAVALAGFSGMLLDSLLGAAWQARYRDPATGELTDVATPGANPEHGFRWMSNDAVNLLANALLTGLTLL